MVSINRLDDKDKDKPREKMSEEEIRNKIFKILDALPKEDLDTIASATGFDKTQKKGSELFHAITDIITREKYPVLPSIMACSSMVSALLQFTREVKGKASFNALLASTIYYYNQSLKIKLEIKKEGAEG